MSNSSSAQPFISLRQATFRLGDALVFENTTWTFFANQQWAALGANGSGKSLLADALRGRLPLVGGEVQYGFDAPTGLSPEEVIGHVSFDDRKDDLHGAVVQSRWNSFEEQGSLKVREFLSYEHAMHINPFEVTDRHVQARPGYNHRLKRAIRMLEVGGFLSRTLLSLSNGERQRVQIAQALAQPLRLLILDDPYVGLDGETRQRFNALLEALLQTELRVLLLTTRDEDLPKGITHVLRLKDCQVLSAGRRPSTIRSGQRDSLRSKGIGGLSSRRRRAPSLSSPEESEHLIELRNVTVRYAKKVIFANLNWTVRRDESWALLGPNGSGKTTLLGLIQGDHPQAYTNDVRVFGTRRGAGESIWELKRRIGWISPELQLHFDNRVSVEDVVLSGFYDTIGLYEEPTKAQRTAGAKILRDFDLRKEATQPLFSLSAGLQRMALLARALVKQPELLILDEPCQGLDGPHRKRFLAQMDRLISAGQVTSIFVTHRSEEIPQAIAKVLRLPDGKIEHRVFR